MVGGVDRPDVGVLVHRITDPQGLHPVLEPLDELLGDRFLDQQPGAGAADLTLVEEDPVDDALHGLVLGGVVEDDVGPLAAQLQGDLAAGAGQLGWIWRPDGGGAGEGDLVQPGMVDQGRADVTRAGTMLTTPGGRSASAMISASTRIDNGVVSAGLITTVLPAARAGAIFQAAISSGKFHGITWPATPSGCGRGPSPRCCNLSAQPAW